jgi:hypothetical protein
MSKHTRGPWRLALSDEGDIGYDESDIAYVESEDVDGNGLYVIARCNGPDRNGNARLIAAAPTMHDYIAKRAAAGDEEAAQILGGINGTR